MRGHRAQGVVPIIVGVIALVAVAIGGVVLVRTKQAGSQATPEMSMAGEIEPAAVGRFWGPERLTYPAASPPQLPTLNSTIDRPGYGDERDFFLVRNVSAGTGWVNSIELKRNDQFEASVYFRNDSDESAANHAHARVEIPALVHPNDDETSFAMAYVRASDAVPSEVWDSVKFANPTAGDFAVRYVPGTARIVTDVDKEGTAVSAESLFSIDGDRDGGVRLGSDGLDGVLPPGAAGRVVFRFVADQAAFNFENRVRLKGTKQWERDLVVQPGAQIEIEFMYTNSGTVDQANVIMKAIWPDGLGYIDGQTELVNTNFPDGEPVDGIAGDGINIGNYSPGGGAYLYVTATVSAPPCSQLNFLAGVETDNGVAQEHSTIRVTGSGCPA